jgi:prepilin-type N-terminal cleavage/methylation domain-containing protein
MKMSGYSSSKPAGFTVIEIILVLAVATIMLAIAIPNLFAVLPGFRLSDAARQVAKDLQVARMKAIAQNRKFRLNFVSSTSYTVQSDQNGDGTIGSTEDESGPFSLPQGITASPLGATSEFQPRGTASAAGTITLQNSNSQTKSVQISVVGRVSIP